jgi:hypothetical protein
LRGIKGPKEEKTMNRIRFILLPLLLTSVGCVTFPSLKDEPASKANSNGRPVANASGPDKAPGPGVRQEIALPPVIPDDVNDINAPEKAEALRRELSREDK